MIQAIWDHRPFILSTVKSEIRGRFARSALGGAWVVLHPLAQAAVLTIVLSEVLIAKLPGIENKTAYAVYLLAGMAAWTLFSDVLGRSVNMFVEHSNALKKIAFPRACLPVIVVLSALINHVILLAAVLGIAFLSGMGPGSALLFLPLGALLIVLFAFGLGWILSIFHVFSRDVGQVVVIVIQFWFWLTPIVYTAEVMPAKFKWVPEVNPMAPLVEIYQRAIVWNQPPLFENLLAPTMLGLLLLLTSWFVYRRSLAELIDAL